MSGTSNLNHLLPDEWDELVVGRVSERASMHLDACPQCRSVADRVSLDESPAPIFRSSHVPARWPWIALSLGALAGAAGYAHAFLGASDERDKLLGQNIHLEAELARQRTELNTLKRLETSTVSSGSQSSPDTEALRDALRRFQSQSTQLTEQRKAIQDLRAQYRDLEQRAKGDADRLADLKAEYDAKLNSKEEALAKVQDELRDTKAQLAKAGRKESLAAFEEELRTLTEAAGDTSIVLADKNVSANRQRGVLTVTMDAEQLEKMRRILETQAGATLSLGCKKGDRYCRHTHRKCEVSRDCVGMRVEYVQAGAEEH